jgi:hypothetical protein
MASKPEDARTAEGTDGFRLEDYVNSETYDLLTGELEEQARLNGMGAERELALMAEIERLRTALDRIQGMCAVKDACACGRPRGIQAVRHCAIKALAGDKSRISPARDKP